MRLNSPRQELTRSNEISRHSGADPPNSAVASPVRSGALDNRSATSHEAQHPLPVHISAANFPPHSPINTSDVSYFPPAGPPFPYAQPSAQPMHFPPYNVTIENTKTAAFDTQGRNIKRTRSGENVFTTVKVETQRLSVSSDPVVKYSHYFSNADPYFPEAYSNTVYPQPSNPGYPWHLQSGGYFPPSHPARHPKEFHDYQPENDGGDGDDDDNDDDPVDQDMPPYY